MLIECTYPTSSRTQRTRMHTLQHQVPLPFNPRTPLLRRVPPCHKHDAPCPLLSHSINHLLREALPAFPRMAVRLMGANSQTSIQQQDSAVCPGRQQTAVLGRRLEIRIVLFQGDVDVFEGWWRRCRRAHGETEAVGLVVVVVGILAKDDDFDGVEGSVSGPEIFTVNACFAGVGPLMHSPGVDICHRREDLLACVNLLLEELLQLEKLLARDIILQNGKPALMQSIDLELQQLFLLGTELRDPGVFVEFRRRSICWIRRACLGGRLGCSEERRDAAVEVVSTWASGLLVVGVIRILLRLLRIRGRHVGCLALEGHCESSD
jgi:hypothetical protein